MHGQPNTRELDVLIKDLSSVDELPDFNASKEEITLTDCNLPNEKVKWPVLKDEALYGLAGDIVRKNDPYTEADPVAVLFNILIAFGNCVGMRPHFMVEHAPHHTRLNGVFVGATAVGKKGTSWATPHKLFDSIDSDWSQNRVTGGLSSGEGLIFQVRDQRREKKPKRGEKEITYDDIIVDHGVADKRLMLIEEEFSQCLKVTKREGNILSPIIRQCFDKGDLRALTKNSTNIATGAHVSIVGHITKDELLSHLNETEQANGFGNRFLWLLVKRSKFLSNPTGLPLNSLNSLNSQLSQSLEFSRQVDEIKRDNDSQDAWDEIYEPLATERPGLTGALLARAPVHVIRLSCIYALLDKSNLIKIPHLKAALALWEYCEESTKLIFGESLGDYYADRILEELKRCEDGFSETEIWQLFGNHGQKRVPNALKRLLNAKLVCKKTGESNGGRPPIIWSYAKKAKKAN